MPNRLPVVLLAAAAGLLPLMAPCFAADEEKPWRADPEVVERLSQRRGEFNYREENVPEYRLPDPLVTSGGQRVDAASEWPSRRAEIMELFRGHVYGRRPNINAEVQFQQVDQVEASGMIGRQIRIRIQQDDRTFDFPLLVFQPAEGTGPWPAVLHINNREFPSLQQAATEPSDFWPVAQIVGRGYVAAAVSTHTIDPDRRDGFEEGIRGFLAGPDATEADQPADAWGALSAWGWGASRALDYLAGRPDVVDASRVAVLGHSRGGKAALWAAAEDPRFAVAFSSNSGCGGAALSRRKFGETVARITSSFPHWFCKRFADYGGREETLPVDQHQLIAAIAPRGVYVTSASEDLWADPRGEYLSLVAAAPVYHLLGHQAIDQPTMPPADMPRVDGRTGYHIRSGAHNLTAFDWMHFLDFSDAQWP